ncbi:MAG TPA: hypothetical protein VE987_06130 [Polyangiaceae bacterium]|nr:hypothetical protein [Polyangiaceae bacterium]
MHRTSVACAVVICLSGAFGCGESEPPPRTPEPPPPLPQRAVPLVAKTSQELGNVDPASVKRAFATLDDKFMECQRHALDRVEVLAGTAKFFLRIGADGSAKWSYLEESRLGDRDTERCLIDAVMAARWPKPDGGDAEVRYSMELPLQSARPPNDWSADKVGAALGKASEALDKCKAGGSTSFRATMYVGPGGKVLAAGVDMSSKDGEEQADCLVKALMKMKGLPSPGSWPAKVSFAL